MPAWWLVTIPLSLALLASLLAMMAWLERRVLSPQSLILRTVRLRNTPPDHVERFVAVQAEQLLRRRR